MTSEKPFYNMDPEDQTPSKPGSIRGVTQDAVFGAITEDGPNYRGLGWFETSVLMMKTMIGLGVLSLPAALDVLGLIPGVLCLLTVATMTIWSMFVVGSFKLNHPEVYAIDDVGYKIFGTYGRYLLGGVFSMYWIFVVGSGMLSFSIALNAVSGHGTCTAVFVVVAAITTFCLASIRTLGRMSWVAWGGLISILGAIIILTISVGVQDRPASAPQRGPWISDYQLFKSPSFLEATSAISTMVFAYSGTSAFFSIIAEMKDPNYYARSLTICQSVVTGTFITIATVVYYYCGSYVSSPALGSAGTLMKKVTYGIGIPGLLASTTILTHVTSKYIFVRLLQGTNHLTANTPRHWITWLGCVFGVTATAYIIASGIPVFNDLVSLVGALFGTLMTFQPMACMWFYDNWKSSKRRTPMWYAMVVWCTFILFAGSFLLVSGTYGSIVNIINSYGESGGAEAWSCADNSKST
ncbi:transmembrane amino acid transporter protein-domain-containing protein [Penicillium brevicompactum]|uniref:Transmembrane amino acid transporter protein-domain-containing protein n=1 Tax=Penicillium brevicompactum TaxID=5074 RepID=A0A9W9RCU1_PENBR|nr:transmembrane amino acid transporter protein-domain-containing protein [Penicillium brevicompactum]